MTSSTNNEPLLDESARHGWITARHTSALLVLERGKQFVRISYSASGTIHQIDAGIYSDQNKRIPFAEHCSHRGRDRRGYARELLAQPESVFGTAAWPRRDNASPRGWRRAEYPSAGQ